MTKKKIISGSVYYNNGSKISERKKIIKETDTSGVLLDGRVVHKRGQKWIYTPK